MLEPLPTSPRAANRTAESPEHPGRSRRRLPHLLILAAACIGATVATYELHHWCVGYSNRGKSHVFGTISLCALIDVHFDQPDKDDKEVLNRSASNPDFKRFCGRILERAQVYRSSTQAPYEVLVAEYGFTYGWPLASRHRYAIASFEEKSLSGVWSGDDFDANYEGEDPPPILYAGLIGNWLFYFALSLLLFEIVYRIALTLWSRITGPPPGHCHTCGYNLTGNVSGICPECGQPVPQADSESTIVT